MVGTNYSTSTRKTYADEYTRRFQETTGISVQEGRLMSYDEASALKNAGRTSILYGEGNYHYLLSTNVNSSYFWGVCGSWSGNEISWIGANADGRIRPLIIIQKSNLN